MQPTSTDTPHKPTAFPDSAWLRGARTATLLLPGWDLYGGLQALFSGMLVLLTLPSDTAGIMLVVKGIWTAGLASYLFFRWRGKTSGDWGRMVAYLWTGFALSLAWYVMIATWTARITTIGTSLLASMLLLALWTLGTCLGGMAFFQSAPLYGVEPRKRWTVIYRKGGWLALISLVVEGGLWIATLRPFAP